MILGPVSLLDCGVFVLFLIPQLLYQLGPITTLLTIIQVLPFLVVHLPYQLIRDRSYTPRDRQSSFVQQASLFQDLVVRCVRYAFANIPAEVGRVFFSKEVAYPFFRFRMIRNGYLTSPIGVNEVHKKGVRGLWICPDPMTKPDLVIYYCHGGGFSMGSTYFYLEFLIAWITRLKERGFKNPAVFALEYTLVPDAVWPKQFEETSAGYKLLTDYMGDPSRICVSGDSAGATLILSRLLHHGCHDEVPVIYDDKKPALAVLISPWTHLVSSLNSNTPSDYLDARSLERYGTQYLGSESATNSVISPGLTEGRWKAAMPSRGYCVIYGRDEVFAPAIEETIQRIKDEGARIKVRREFSGIHAWPVVNLFLGRSKEERLRGVNQVTDMVVSRMRTVQIMETPKKKVEEANPGAYPSPTTPTSSKWSPLTYLL